MSVFTVILDYRGGTYIKQIAAKNPRSALVAWSQSLAAGEIQGIGPKRAAKISQEIQENYAGLYEPVLLKGLNNVWCTGIPHGQVNIVKTDTSS